MAAVTVADFKTKYAGDRELEVLTDRASGQGPNDAVIQAAIDSAWSMMLSYFAARHSVADVAARLLTDANLAAVARDCNGDLANWLLLSQRQHKPSEAKQRLYEHWIGWLKEVSKGDAFLPADPQASATTSFNPVAAHGFGTAVIERDGGSRIFSRESLVQC